MEVQKAYHQDTHIYHFLLLKQIAFFCREIASTSFRWNNIDAGVCLCVCLHSSTVKASSDCKRNLRGTDQQSCVVKIYLGASAKFLHLGIWKYHISPPKTEGAGVWYDRPIHLQTAWKSFPLMWAFVFKIHL